MILIGPPGSGKGTQAKLLCQRLGLVHFATGDILRDAMKKKRPEGELARPFMDKGQLVPDAVVNEIVNSRLRASDRPRDFVMDGYPRTLEQAVSFDSVLKEQSLQLDAVVYLKVDDEEIVRRNSARLTCINPECKATYNLVSKPPKITGRCDLCKQLLFQRDDDKAETIRNRLQIFHDRHQEILQHYKRHSYLIEVHGCGDIEGIYAAVIQSLKVQALRR